ncbi:hypothetical protein LTR04_001069 [Oleoguttula sp. CCFEE 6159]|nr:hypothetical protein LTR04_001069 [Oleoguttula sp. CCFEE 6159]
MGIHGIYKELGPGDRIALSRLSVSHYEKHGRPFRLAIDVSIWLFQIQSGKGGTNPALRTFYYRLLRLLSLSIHPLFVFDGPNKPTFKRNKRVGGVYGAVKGVSLDAFLARQLLKQFGFPIHNAPGEAEADCALLQKSGVVDAVLSEDVDTLMFGSGITLRNWSAELKSSKVPTHVNLYDSEKTRAGAAGLDREGMVLIALMSGGDYLPEGIPGCGPKLACEAARAGFGASLCAIGRKDKEGLKAWRDQLAHEIKTNESKFFRQKRKALVIPEDFPNREVLRYYTHPYVSNAGTVEDLKQTLEWDAEIDVVSLRKFTDDAFEWHCISGAKKFIRNLAPPLLVRELRLRGERAALELNDDLEVQQRKEAKLVKTIHGKRTHVTTDSTPELRVGIKPIELVRIDLDAEKPDELIEEGQAGNDSDSEMERGAIGNAAGGEDEGSVEQCPGSPTKKRGSSTYDPTEMDKVWVFETFVKIGVPLKLQDWEESFRNPRKYLAMKSATNKAVKGAKVNKPNKNGGMAGGALDRFTKVTKPGVSVSQRGKKSKEPRADGILIHDVRDLAPSQRVPASVTIQEQFPVSRINAVDLSSIEDCTASHRPVHAPLNSRQPVSDIPEAPSKTNAPAIDEVDFSHDDTLHRLTKRRKPTPPSPVLRTPFDFLPPHRITQHAIIDLISSPESTPPPRVRVSLTPTPPNLRHMYKPDDSATPLADLLLLDLPSTVTRRRRRSPFHRSRTLPTTLDDAPPLLSSSRPATPPPLETATVTDVAISPSLPIPSLFKSTLSTSMRLASPDISLRDTTLPTTLPPSQPTPSKAKVSVEVVELLSSPEQGPPTTTTGWIRRSTSITPSKARHANVDFSSVAPVSVIPLPPSHPPSAMPVFENEDMQLDTTPAPPPISVADLMPSFRRLRERDDLDSRAKPKFATRTRQQATTKPNEATPELPIHLSTIAAIPCPNPSSPTSHYPRRSPRQHRPSPPALTAPARAKKRAIKLRDSLEGSWKITDVEQVDMTGSGGVSLPRGGGAAVQGREGAKRGWRVSEVEVLDLTAG